MSKLTSLHEAVAPHVHDGDLVYAAGFTHLIPFAAAHEIIRQGRKDLALARATPDLIYDQMVAAGCARKLIFSYAGNPGIGSLRALRSAMEGGPPRMGGVLALRHDRPADGRRLRPALPADESHRRGGPGQGQSQLSHRRRSLLGRQVVTVPALHPDVAIVHVQRADAEGNCHLWGILGEQKEAAFASHRVLVTAEEIVDPEVIRSDPNRTLIPSLVVDAVCHVPYCAHPSYTQGYYDRDNAFYLAWDDLSADREDARLAGRMGLGRARPAAYWEKLGPEVHARLRVEPRWSQPVNYGAY